jgi:hypothetical protein
MKLINKTPRKHVEEGYVEVLSDSSASVVISNNYKGKLVKLSNNDVTISFDDINLKVNDYGTLDFRGTGSFTLFNDVNLTYVTIGDAPLSVTSKNSMVYWIKTADSEYRLYTQLDLKSINDSIDTKRGQLSPFNVTDEHGNDQSSEDLDFLYPPETYGLNIFRYSDEGTASENLYFRVSLGNWVRFHSSVVADSSYAKKIGDVNQRFNVADAVETDEAVSLGQLNTKQDTLILDDSLYLDPVTGIISSNITSFTDIFIYDGINNIFTTSFDVVNFLPSFYNNAPLPSKYFIFTSPNKIEMDFDLNVGDEIHFRYEHFVIPPTY